MPSVAEGAIGYLVALLLAFSFRHVVLGKILASTSAFQRKLTKQP